MDAVCVEGHERDGDVGLMLLVPLNVAVVVKDRWTMRQDQDEQMRRKRRK